MTEVDLYITEKDLSIRSMQEADYADWVLLNREDPHPIPPDNLQAPDYTIYRHMLWENRINSLEHSGWIQAGIWHDEDIVGLINLYTKLQSARAQLGYEIAPGYRRRGFASAAVEALASYALSELELEQLEILVGPNNIASKGVALKAGFENAGASNGYVVFCKAGPGALITSSD